MIKSFLAHRWARHIIGCVILLGISASLILPNLGSPRAIIFDETYFIPTTQKYLNGVFFLEPHPPLAKLLIALGERLYQPNQSPDQFITVEKVDKDWSAEWDITGYRIAPAIFGIVIPALVFLILCIVLENKLTAFLLTLPILFDNAIIAQSRAALIDSFLIVFCLASVLVFVYVSRRVDWRFRALIVWSVLWGAMAGSAASVKLTGLFILLLVGLYGLKLLWSHQVRRGLIVGIFFSLAFGITYLGTWAIHFSIAQRIIGSQDYGISATHRQILAGEITVDPLTRFVVQMQDAIDYQRRYEAGVPKLDLTKPDEIGSPWYWWLVGGRAIDYRWETSGNGAYGYVYLMGNPATGLISLLGVVFATAALVADLIFGFLPTGRRQWLYSFVLLYWGYMIPIMFIERVMYLYHYLPPLIIGVILFALVFREAKRIPLFVRRGGLVLVLLLVIVAFFVYKPLTYNEPLTGPEFRQRNIWPAWDLRCVGC